MNAKRKSLPRYDVFICHASEDKVDFVRPLATALRSFGVHVWYDEFTLSVGDSLTRSIDRGLAKSRYGVVILSAAFLKKAWPEYELAGLVTKEIGKKKVILPVWHGITKSKLLKYSPTLSDKYALHSDKFDIEELAVELIGIVRPDLFQKIQRRAAFIQAVRRGVTKKGQLKNIRYGPPRHEWLPLDLISRIRLIRAALLSVYPHSMKFWINGLRGDFHPSSEIRIWERVASCFVEYSSLTELSAKQHRALFDIVVALSCGCQVGELGEKMKILPKDAADKIMLLWKYPVPPFDIKNDDFPMHYRLSPKDEERFKQVDAETFPNDVPNELIERIISGKSVDSPRVNNKSASKKGGSK